MSVCKSTFGIKSVIADFLSSFLVQVAVSGSALNESAVAVIGGGTGDMSSKAILSLAYAGGRALLNFASDKSETIRGLTQGTGFLPFAIEILLTSALFYLAAYLIGYDITIWYALVLGLAAPVSDRLNLALCEYNM